MELEAKHLKGALTKAEADLALKKGRRKVETMEAKKKLAEVKKKVKERSTETGCLAMEAYKASTDFAAEKAQVVVAFKTLEEFYDNDTKFNKEAFHEGHKLGQANYHFLVATQYP